MSSTLAVPPPIAVPGETALTQSLANKSSLSSFKKKDKDGVVVTTAAVSEDGLDDIDSGWEGYMDTELPDKMEGKFFRYVCPFSALSSLCTVAHKTRSDVETYGIK